MTEHYTRNTVSAESYCPKCGRMTQHRIDGVRKGPCLECIIKLEAQHLGIPVAMRNGELSIKCTDATFDLLMKRCAGDRPQIEVPARCTCRQRPYPHELHVHNKQFEAPGTYEIFDGKDTVRMKWADFPDKNVWPWSLRKAPDMEAK
jgi:hypothetical protein